MKCARCNRTLKLPSASGLGPRCAVYMLGSQPRRPRLFDKGLRKADDKQGALFEEVRP